jgi:hypothetical protein
MSQFTDKNGGLLENQDEIGLVGPEVEIADLRRQLEAQGKLLVDGEALRESYKLKFALQAGRIADLERQLAEAKARILDLERNATENAQADTEVQEIIRRYMQGAEQGHTRPARWRGRP